MYSQLENNIHAWAENEPLVQALVVIGSRANLSRAGKDHAADRWSDLDLLLFVSNQEALAGDRSWLKRFGQVWLSHLQITGAGFPEWFVIYEGGLKADFLLAPASKSLSEVLYGPLFGVATRRGVRVLVDKGEIGPFEHTDLDINQHLPETEAFERAV